MLRCDTNGSSASRAVTPSRRRRRPLPRRRAASAARRRAPRARRTAARPASRRDGLSWLPATTTTCAPVAREREQRLVDDLLALGRRATRCRTGRRRRARGRPGSRPRSPRSRRARRGARRRGSGRGRVLPTCQSAVWRIFIDSPSKGSVGLVDVRRDGCVRPRRCAWPRPGTGTRGRSGTGSSGCITNIVPGLRMVARCALHRRAGSRTRRAALRPRRGDRRRGSRSWRRCAARPRWRSAARR